MIARAGAALLAAMALGGCAAGGNAPAPTPLQSGTAGIAPVEMAQLRGREVLIFPEISVPDAAARIDGFVETCLSDGGTSYAPEPHGFRLIDPAGNTALRVMYARIRQSSAVALDGSALAEPLKAAMAASVQGELTCPAALS